MKCPACFHPYTLGWSEYIKQYRGCYTCPQCGRFFRLNYSVTYIFILTGVCALVMAAPALLVLKYSGNLWACLAVSTALGLCIGLPLDRWLDSHLRIPVLIENIKETNISSQQNTRGGDA